MKYCSQCGEPNVDEANFCHNCGRDLSKDVVKGQGKQSEKIEPHGDTPAPTPSDKKQGMDSWTLYRALDVAMLLLVTFAPWIRFNLLVHSQDLSLLGSMQAIKSLSQNTGVSSGELGFLAILMLVLWLVSVCSLIRDLMDDAKEKPNSAIGAITVIMACVVVLIATYWQNNSWNNPDTSNVAARLISSATQNPFSVTGWFWITALVGVATCVVKRSNRLQGDAQSSSFVEAMEQFGKKFIPDPTKTDTIISANEHNNSTDPRGGKPQHIDPPKTDEDEKEIIEPGPEEDPPVPKPTSSSERTKRILLIVVFIQLLVIAGYLVWQIFISGS